ncbi:MAG: hypothetical protein MRY63_06450 [Neomegalonema sp.]|nr:hypothetical protein [Neomegalonema sp.]
MVAYNFKDQFVQPISLGIKRQTIRRASRRRHAAVGELVQLYTGMRTKGCRKIVAQDPVCVLSCSVAVSELGVELGAGDLLASGTDELQGFARLTGFSGWDEMLGFYGGLYGGGFEGVLTRWELSSYCHGLAWSP